MSQQQAAPGGPQQLPPVWAIVIPVFIELVLTFSVFFSDSFFLSRISDAVAASVGTTIPIFMVCVLVAMMMAQGASNAAGQFNGAGQTKESGRIYCAVLVVNAVLGLLTALAMGFGASVIAKGLGLTGDEHGHAVAFMSAIAPALIFIGLKYALGSVFVSRGQTVWTMFGGVVAIAVNIALNIVFQRAGMGIEGVALATILAQVAVILFYVVVMLTKVKSPHEWRAFFAAPAEPIRNVLRIGVPSVVQPVSAELAMLVIAAAAVHLGTEAMAARVYVMNLATVAICWAAAVSIGNQVLVAILVGAGQPQAANAVLMSNLRIAVVGSLLIALALWASGGTLVGIFTQDPKIIAISTDLLVLAILLEPARSLGTLSSFALKAAGDANYPASVGLGVTWLVAVPLAVYLCLYSGLGMAGLWVGLVVDETLRGMINFRRWQSGRWQSKALTMPTSSAKEAL
jgi:putative MATE family efflux protein